MTSPNIIIRVLVHSLLSLIYYEYLITGIIQPSEISFTIGKLKKVLLDPFLFTNRKNLSTH